MLNFKSLKKQFGSLLLLSVVLTGVTAAPSFAHKAKLDTASTHQVTEGEKIALVEGNVAVQASPAVTVEEAPVTRAPMTLKQVEKFNFDFGGAYSSAGI